MANFLLLITAALWGLAFVAQRKGMESLDAFTFNAIRFALGAIFVRFALYRSFAKRADIIRLPGIVLFVAATFQQIGLIYTSAGSAGFITGLYVIFVPLIGIFRGQRLSRRVLYGILLAVLGLYLINRFESLQMSLGNLLVLISAVFFAWHVQIVDKYSKLYPTGMLAFDQFGVCALLSFIFAGIWRIFMHPYDTISTTYLQNIGIALIPILYGGLISVGIAYTLQIKAQREAEPAPAAVIMCLEGVFAMIGGYLILSENITLRSILGAAMLLIAMLLVSIPKKVIDRKCPVDLSAQT
jgi:drug/metabolite transporter (DMT)-like permease